MYVKIKNKMENLQRKINDIVRENVHNKNLDCSDLEFKMTNEIMVEILKYQNSNYNNILEFCEILDGEKNGLLFIKKMIRNLII